MIISRFQRVGGGPIPMETYRTLHWKVPPQITAQNICTQLMSRVSEIYRNPALN